MRGLAVVEARLDRRRRAARRRARGVMRALGGARDQRAEPRLEAEEAVRDPAERDRAALLSRPRSASSSSSLSSAVAVPAEARRRSRSRRSAASAGRCRPIAMQARESARAFRRRATPAAAAAQSPVTPPSPAGSGQVAVRGRQAAKPAASSIGQRPRTRSRMRSRCSGRWVASRQPQTATGSTSATAATPNSCISRSATMAPGRPSRLRTGALVAWLSEGSCTDQVASASASSMASAISARPPSSRRRRRSASRSASDRKLKLSRPRSMRRHSRDVP